MARVNDLQPTPIWLADPEYPAPCPCGRPMMQGEPVALVVGDHGLKRLVHASCLAMMMAEEDDDE